MNPTTRLRRLSISGAVIFVQGAVLTYLSALNVLHLHSLDLSLTRSGTVASIALLPAVVKMVSGVMRSRVSPPGLGHRTASSAPRQPRSGAVGAV